MNKKELIENVGSIMVMDNYKNEKDLSKVFLQKMNDLEEVKARVDEKIIAMILEDTDKETVELFKDITLGLSDDINKFSMCLASLGLSTSEKTHKVHRLTK